MRVSDDVLMAFAESCLPGADRAEMARELLAARKAIASSRLVVEWAEPVTTDDWAEYDAAILALREYDAGETSVEVVK
jgi:hypothetical protein